MATPVDTSEVLSLSKGKNEELVITVEKIVPAEGNERQIALNDQYYCSSSKLCLPIVGSH